MEEAQAVQISEYVICVLAHQNLTLGELRAWYMTSPLPTIKMEDQFSEMCWGLESQDIIKFPTDPDMKMDDAGQVDVCPIVRTTIPHLGAEIRKRCQWEMTTYQLGWLASRMPGYKKEISAWSEWRVPCYKMISEVIAADGPDFVNEMVRTISASERIAAELAYRMAAMTADYLKEDTSDPT